jgi:hypothetical protein
MHPKVLHYLLRSASDGSQCLHARFRFNGMNPLPETALASKARQTVGISLPACWSHLHDMAMSLCVIRMTPVQSAINTRHLFSSIMQAAYGNGNVNVNPQVPDHLCTDSRILHVGHSGNDEHQVKTSRAHMHT